MDRTTRARARHHDHGQNTAIIYKASDQHRRHARPCRLRRRGRACHEHGRRCALLGTRSTDNAQTKFVLRQALRRGHKAIVVITRSTAPGPPEPRPERDVRPVPRLGATNEQAEYETIYTNAITGSAGTDIDTSARRWSRSSKRSSTRSGPDVDDTAPTQLLVTTTATTTTRAASRSAAAERPAPPRPAGRADRPSRRAHEGQDPDLFTFQGLAREPVDEVRAGDIVAVAGVPDVGIGDTIADANDPRPLPPISVEAPTLQMTFAVNTSPFAGREGQHVTSRKLRERLYTELERDVALKVDDTDSADTFTVSGRGELHLAILIENLRREGYELQVSRPQVIEKVEAGVRLEPYEQLEIEVSKEQLGPVVELRAAARGAVGMKYRVDGSAHASTSHDARIAGLRQQFLRHPRAGSDEHIFAGKDGCGGNR